MDSLISTQALADQLDADDLVVLDASGHLPAANRNASEEFATGHIPGARFFDLTRLVDKTSPVPSAHPRPGQLTELLAECGVTQASRVVIYDARALRTSARAWFLLHAHGFENAAILDGGLAKWKAEGCAMESGVPEVAKAEPLALKSPSRFRYKSDMLANLDSGVSQVLDARDNGRFSGSVVDTVHDMPSGHIPNSCNLPFGSVFADNGTYKTSSQLEELFKASGTTLDSPVITTCGSGVTACVLLFALHLTGRNDTALYDGSWLDWGSDPDTPKATSVLAAS